ncbi:efflux RND transporter periplasmic adaptor subunit [Caminibacter pacificus]
MKKSLVFLILVLIFSGCAKTKEDKAIHIKDDNVTLRLEGMAYPSKKFVLYSAANGTVEKVYVQNGSKVKPGDKILKLSTKSLDLDIEKLKTDIKNTQKEISEAKKAYYNYASLNITKKELKKMALLHSKGYASEFEVDNYKKNYLNELTNIENQKKSLKTQILNLTSTLENQKIELKKLLLQKQKANAVSPVYGFVANLSVSPTQEITANQKICEILNIDTIKVKAGLPPGLLPFVKVGQRVRIDFITEPQYSTYAKITKINPIVDKKFQNMTIEIEVKNKNYLIQPQTRALIMIFLSPKDQEKVKKLTESKGGIIEIPSDI